MPSSQDALTLDTTKPLAVDRRTSNKDPLVPGPLNTVVKLTMGQLFYRDANGQSQRCLFQFNPTEIERSRNIAFTRSPTGNTREEPSGGGRNSAKRKQTRKPENWEMSVTLRFDAGYGMVGGALPSPLPKLPPATTQPPPAKPKPAAKPKPEPTGYAKEIQRIDDTIKFFEHIAEAEPFKSENEKVANADETPPPPYVILAFGLRAFHCAVKSVRIKEEDYTPDLSPRRFEVTLSLEILETTLQDGPEQ